MASVSTSKAEISYIQSGLLSNPPLRADGRALHDFRTINLETGVVPLANGSAHLSIGQNAHHGGNGTEVLSAAKLEVENVEQGEGIDGGRIICTVTCSPSAYPHLSSQALEDLQYDMTTILHETFAHMSLLPKNLGILPGKKSWTLYLDSVVLTDSGNTYDALFMAARAALWDCKVPRTRSVEYKAPTAAPGSKAAESGQMDVDLDVSVQKSGFDTMAISHAVDFELPDYWDEGEVLDGRERWPVCVTLNVAAQSTKGPVVPYLDAILQEEAATPLRLLLVLSFPPGSSPNLHSMRLLGPGELDLSQIRDFVTSGEKYAQKVWEGLNGKLKEEDLRRGQKARDRFARR
ncbi:ribosomal protein S5 domain 2-type protein [Roridomyces roridus]|uniref:Ribosomal RNA-processing protein 42 n=1 Tax=Roridomyces roridus TaxID=1738132 RepID=A0AAD7BR98_9AGAR|nr:ribosomal protein S5 domain 2-type protein [Roridomyces roridus]